MKKFLYIGLLLIGINGYAQNVQFSFSVDNSNPTTSVVSVYAEGTQVTNNEMTTFGITLYFDANEASITLPGAVDFSPAAAFGWTIGTNSTSSVSAHNNPNVPITHTHYVEVAPFDEFLSGTAIPMGTPTLFFRVTFDRSINTPEFGGQIYLGGTDTNESLQGADENVEPFPIVAVGFRTQVLPITLVSFNAEKHQTRSSLLTWSTASEINSSHFLVQRSSDKKEWKTVGKVNAAGESQIIRNYNFVDENVYNGFDASLIVYYRLMSIDLDGQTKGSPIESVVFGNSDIAKGRNFIAYPNPASDGIHVAWNADIASQPTDIEFYDTNGKQVFTHKVGENSHEEYVDFTRSNLQAGLYLMRVMSGDEPVEFKQIVIGQK